LGKLNGKVIACIVALKYSKKFGFIAVYWVKKAYRGKGYGYRLFVKAM
jgi:N-acetylglutamate synthase-like GNAT family acetyltransferase